MASVEVKVRRADRTYRPEETVTGVVVVNAPKRLSHNGVTLSVEGGARLDLSAKSVGLFEAFYNNVKPLELMSLSFQVVPPGRFEPGVWEIPFEFNLEALEDLELFETYHGVFVNVRYIVSVEMARSMLRKNLKKSIEFVVHLKQPHPMDPQRVEFSVVPQSLKNVKKTSLSRIPDFQVDGFIDSVVCEITTPFTGVISVAKSDAHIRSIEVQLVRVETISSNEGNAKEATEIQNIQLADGDVCRGMEIPIHMIFPRLFTCPTLRSRSFKVEFEVNLVILLEDGYQITENFPIKLYRN